MQRFHSNGKLLLTGEYAVLHGARALAIPCKFGQDLQVEQSDTGQIVWKSYTVEGENWLSSEYAMSQIIAPEENPLEQSTDILLRILQKAHTLNPVLLTKASGFNVKTHLEFPNSWGLGSSSTLIANIASWFNVNPYELLSVSFGGSGYDIACADATTPLIYQLEEGKPKVEVLHWYPQWIEQTYFLHLNKKQNSRESIAHFKKKHPQYNSEFIAKVSDLTAQIMECPDLKTAQTILLAHENLIATTLDLQRIQTLLFADFNGLIKSLGGWGGDFVWVLSNEGNPAEYFKAKGYETLIPFNEMASL